MTKQAVELLRQGVKGGRALAGQAIDLLLPPRCLSCGLMVTAQGLLCQTCWSELNFIAEPCCRLCGLPFDYDRGGGALCPTCIAAPPSYDRARALLRYDAAARRLLLPFKHVDRTGGAAPFAAWMARSAPSLLAGCDAVVPVPLHWRRLWRRRYNQAALLSLELARLGGRVHLPDLLARVRATASQGHLSRSGRQRNVAGAFSINPRLADRVPGANFLLVDDVMTTGATLEACARLLRRAGAARIDVLVMARVVR